MSATFKCDGCGKEAPAVTYGRGWQKPHDWFQREDADGIQDACSRECVDKVAAASGKSRAILPF